MTPGNPFPDIEKILVEVLTEFGTTGTVTPEDLQEHLPFIRIVRLPGGGADTINDYSRVEISIFATTRAEGVPLAERVRQFLAAAPISAVAGRIDRTTAAPGFVKIPWDDQSTAQRWLSAFGFTARRTTS